MKNATHTAHLLRRLRWDELDTAYLQRLIATARDEDLAGLGLASPPARSGDPTTALTPGAGKPARAHLVARRACTVCGLPLLPLILAAYGTDARATLHLADGTAAAAGDCLATLDGTAATLLTAERILLNFLQKLTGVATLTATYAAALDGTDTRLLDTRKTTPGWRMLEKYAVATGGGWNHRLGLFDRVMLKDNHLAADDATSGARLAALVRGARAARPDLPVECEVDRPEQIAPVLEAGADVILLDNFPEEDLRPSLAQIGEQAWTEVSGGVTLATLGGIARLGPDFVSTGALTHQAAWVDVGLDWEAR
ncbi:MAG: carboxylating nicotinate-nucleotide diphosphorylase [Puniceicoccales bacterium]|jgi:nicotinate-nucleotide pyrophosphorylase (carboxylating)|nr:carboxylating nicotinate-nucleotide diphosphorylase [Puniceicoccales bacterium]